MTVTLRAAVPTDAGEISRLYAQSWRAAYPGLVPQSYLDELQDHHWTQTVTDWITTGRFTALLAFEKEVMAGCAIYGRAREEKYEGWGELVSLYVMPGRFRKGYGSRLVQRMVQEMKAQGLSGCYLWVLDGNRRARAFYEKAGFEDTGETLTFTLADAPLLDCRYRMEFKPR